MTFRISAEGLKLSAVDTLVCIHKLLIITYDYKINLSMYSQATPSRYNIIPVCNTSASLDRL